jgi:SAM-dependent methyltransferase
VNDENTGAVVADLPNGNAASEAPALVRLDLGCGKNKAAGFIGVDTLKFDGVDVACDLSQHLWKFSKDAHPALKLQPTTIGPDVYILADESVDEVHCSHFLEHLTGKERVGFFNELYRVLKPGAQARFITPHWSNERAYGDPTHQWPPVCSWTYPYLEKAWRDVNAPHSGYTCNFSNVLIGTHDPNDQWVAFRNAETKGVLMTRNINTTVELIATLTKLKAE